jgi:hypothetical protein
MASAYDLTYGVSTPREVRADGAAIRFDDGIPSPESAAAAYDLLDRHHAFDAFLNGLPAVSMWALHEGFLAAGVPDNAVLIFSGLIDSASLLLTANCDTIYYLSFLDLSRGPVVVEVPPNAIGTIDDMWWRWVTDFGVPGADRGAGGVYLLVPPGYDGPLPEGGMFVRHSRTARVALLGRRFMDGDDPAPGVEQIKRHLKIFPYVPGGFGSSIASYLQGRGPLAVPGPAIGPQFIEGTGMAINTLPPTDERFWSMLNAAVQAESSDALDTDMAGAIAEIGIEHGRPFQPDARLRTILAEELAVANACVRTITVRSRVEEAFQYYPDSGSYWVNQLLAAGHDFTTPPPRVTSEGLEPFPPTGARRINARASFFYLATGITPAMCMHLPGLGSQYLAAFLDANGIRFDGGRTYRLTLPDPIPAQRCWSVTVYDNQTRSMLATAQRYPRAGSQAYPTPAAAPDPDGSTVIYFSPRLPHGVAEGNWVQTTPGRGWFSILRLYGPEPAFFDRTWKPSEIEAIA